MKAELTLPERPAAVHLLAVLDILVLLVVFFVLLTSIAQEAGVTIRAPESSFRLMSHGRRIVVTARGGAEPVVYVGSERVSMDQLEETLVKKAEEDRVDIVLLNADQMLPLGVARKIEDICLQLDLIVLSAGRQGGEEAGAENGTANPSPPPERSDEETKP